MKLCRLSNEAWPATKAGEGLKQFESAATPGLPGSMRQNPWAVSEIQAWDPTQFMPRGCVIPAANSDPVRAAGGIGVGEGTGAGGPKPVSTIPSVVAGAITS